MTELVSKDIVDKKDNELKLTEDLFEIVGCKDLDSEVISRPSITFWQDVRRRFKKDKLAVVGFVVLIVVMVLTIFGPIITGYDFSYMDYSIKNLPPNSQHWFGTDEMGRDVFTRVCIGGRVSIIIGILCTIVNFIIGAMLGSIAGFKGGRADNIIMRLVEIVGSLPYLVIVVLFSVVFGKGLFSLMLAMTITAWGGTTRLVRGQILQIKEQEFILAARALGGDTKKIISKHLLPNVMGIVIVSLTLSVPGFIFTEAYLSFLGIGVQPPNTSWGALASAAQQRLMFQPYQLFFPCLMIVLTMLSFNLIGDGLTDALDPKLRQ